MEWETQIKPVLKYVVLVALLILALFPLWYAFALSTRGGVDVFKLGLKFLPYIQYNPDFSSWISMFVDWPVSTYFKNSVIVSAGTAALATLVGTLGAYGFARLEFPGREILFCTNLLGFLFPVVLITIPAFVIMGSLGLINTYIGMIVAFTCFTLPYCIWLLRSFFEQMPPRLEEKASLDGCGKFETFFRIVVPNALPAIGSIFMLAFLLAWHNFVFANVMALDSSRYTLTVGLKSMQSAIMTRNINVLMATITISILIPMIFFMFMQKYLIRGLAGE